MKAIAHHVVIAVLATWLPLVTLPASLCKLGCAVGNCPFMAQHGSDDRSEGALAGGIPDCCGEHESASAAADNHSRPEQRKSSDECCCGRIGAQEGLPATDVAVARSFQFQGFLLANFPETETRQISLIWSSPGFFSQDQSPPICDFAQIRAKRAPPITVFC
ncbi:MAG: hypothetical protein HY234_01880 [Acidobacteria bacterium]|nr:hypothetical protein [Acidobacteriota bacterium]